MVFLYVQTTCVCVSVEMYIFSSIDTTYFERRDWRWIASGFWFILHIAVESFAFVCGLYVQVEWLKTVLMEIQPDCIIIFIVS